jgi:phytoene dehydrogenase-like protein
VRYDVAIIGAGFSGLAAGVRLAHFGRRVCILERHSVWGGLNSFYKKGGRLFDTGLHAVTNFVKPEHRGPRLPLQRIARQLRIDLERFELEPQTRSDIVFGDAKLSFTNHIEHLRSEVGRLFPKELDGFLRLEERCKDYPDLSKNAPHVSARSMLGEFISDPLLKEMILARIFFYGSAEENDIDFEQFIILFKSIFEEGFARPRGGIKSILDVLVSRYQEAGGEIRKKEGVEKLVVDGGRVGRVLLESGEEITAGVIISSAGLVETMKLRSDLSPASYERDRGRLSFMESIWVLDTSPEILGHDACVTFFNSDERLRWESPKDAVDLRSGVICCPSNYSGRDNADPPLVRATHLASPAAWRALDRTQGELHSGRDGILPPPRSAEYAAAKRDWNARSLEVVERHVGPLAERVVGVDAFTPRTVAFYTSKENGAIYGSVRKLKTGRTDLANLFLCGTDQGLAGIVGAMLSGIQIANSFGMEGSS